MTLHGTQTFVTEVQETVISCQATNPVGLLLAVTLDQGDFKRSNTFLWSNVKVGLIIGAVV